MTQLNNLCNPPIFQGATSATDVFTTNAIQSGAEEFGLFPAVAMVNHSCWSTAAWGSTSRSAGNFMLLS